MPWAPEYITGDDLQDFVRIDDDIDDDELTTAAGTANRLVDHFARRQFGQVDELEDREYFVRWDRRREQWVADIDDLMTLEGLLVDGAPIAAPELAPINALQTGRPFTRLVVPESALLAYTGTGEPRVVIRALWGWATVPPAVTQAAYLQASRMFVRRDAPFGVAGSPESGTEIRLSARLDPDVQVAVRAYRRVARPR